jgi:hypothetical protein
MTLCPTNAGSRPIAWTAAFCWLALGGAASAQAVRVGADAPVSIDLRRPAVEPFVAADPVNADHVLGATIVAAVPPERIQTQRCATFVSANGGGSWEHHEFPIIECYDPWVAFLPDGGAVFVALGSDLILRGKGNGLLVYHSADGGHTWDERPAGLDWGHDHPMVAVDRSTSARRGWIYVVSSHDSRVDTAKTRFTVFVARSRDGGKSFDPPVSLTSTNMLIKAEPPAVLADGTLIVPYVEAATANGQMLPKRRAWVVRSTDGGGTFSRPMSVGAACGPPGFTQSSLAADVSAGRFRSRLYFVCNSRETHSVAVSFSADAGITWSTPIPASPAPADSAISRRVMATAVNKNGVLGIIWNEAFASADTRCYHVVFAASVDGGKTFLPSQRVSSAASCPNVPVNGPNWGGGGDYFGLDADERGRFRVVWADSRGGMFQLRTALVEVK